VEWRRSERGTLIPWRSSSGAGDSKWSKCRRKKRSGQPMLRFQNGPWFKTEGAGQLLISATTDRQLTPFRHEPRTRKDWVTAVVAAKDRGPGPIGCGAMTCGQVMPRSSPRGNKFLGRGLLARGRRPCHRRSRFVPRRPEKLREAQPRQLERPSRTEDPGTSTRTSKTSAKRRTHRSPMLAHETSPVSGASVVGMT
jgi:hypothetical protein